jgi:hypothetical protein
MPPLIVFLVAVLDLYFVHKAAEAVTKIDVDSVTPRGTQSVATVAVATPMAVAPDGGGHRNSSQQLVSAGALEHAGKDWKEGRGRHIPFIRAALLSAALAFSFRSCPPLSTFECVDPGHVLRARYL